MIGQTLSHYRITATLGKGGMGEVYRAEDTKLRREVALKILPREVADDPARLERFQREAESLAALNHPNIVSIYSIETVDEIHFLTLELVEGESLDRAIPSEGLPLDRFLDLAIPLADALSEAHEHGIVHRDLKPANVMIDSKDRPKILDFGLAKLRQPEWSADASQLPTELLTQQGTVMGTYPYMSPEQVEGKSVDHRSDIFSMGTLLYEMATGERPFQGDSPASLISSILRDMPDDVARARGDLPDRLNRVIRACLQKHPDKRYQRAEDLQRDLEALRLRRVGKVEMAPVAPQPAAAEATQRSVAVLPFLSFSPDPEGEYFADGMTEDVIAGLVKIRGLTVIARTSVMRFKTREEGLREIGERLGVSTLLDGSIRQAGERVRIVVQLIDAETEQPLWSETYDRRLDDIFAIQSDVAIQIAAALEAELSTDVEQRIRKRPTDNLAAYRLYLEGRHCVLRHTSEGIRKGLELQGRAIRLDPEYALAHFGTAWAYVLISFGFVAGVLTPREAYAKAKQAALTAVELDPESGEARSILAMIHFASDYDWRSAEREIRQALELNPGSAEIHAIFGLFLAALERHDEAIVARRRAQELDPLSPGNSSDLATSYIRMGSYEDAIREAQRLIDLEPDFPMAHSTLGWSYLRTGRLEEGLSELRRAVEVAPDSSMLLAQLGQAYAEVGEREKARAILVRLEQMSADRYVSPYHLAYVHTGLGEHDRAVECLEKAFDERAGGLYGVKGSFLFHPLRAHPGFQALLQRMGLA